MATYGGFDGSIIAPWGARTAKEYATAVGGALAQAPAQFGQTKGQMYDSFQKGYGTYNQGLQGLGQSYAQNYAAMAGGIGGIANALGNTWNNAQSQNQANSAAAAAQQAAISNLGTAAMANYGNVAGAGMQAWAQNQNGYQRSLADMNVGNQNAMSQLGIGRYNALAGLGKSGAAMQVGRDVSAAIPSLGGGQASGATTGGEGFSMLEGLRGDINNGAELSALNNNYYSGLDSLNAEQAIARNTPRDMVSDAYRSMMDFNRMNLGASQQGMNQFYDNAARFNDPSRPGQSIPTGSLLEALAGGYSDSAGRIGGVQKDMNSGFVDAKGVYKTASDDLNDLFNRSVGKMLTGGSGQDALQRKRSQLQQELMNVTRAGYRTDDNITRTLAQVERMLAGAPS
jgi:hypothetical protein